MEYELYNPTLLVIANVKWVFLRSLKSLDLFFGVSVLF